MLINFLVRMLQYEQILNMKNYKPTPNTYQQKSQILFHKNISPRDLYIITLILCYAYGLKGVKLQDFISLYFYIIASYYSISKALYNIDVENVRIPSPIHKSIPNHNDFPAIL